MNTAINTTIPYSHVYVSPFDADIYLSIHVQNGGANVILTKDQAQMLIDQLTKLVSGEKSDPMAAKSLFDLCNRLNEWNIDDLQKSVKMSDLPTFGGEESLEDVWSWDEANVLCHNAKKDVWFIAPRGDDEPPEQDPEPAYRGRGTYSLEELKGIL
jgi:hypothetical protein